MPAQSKREIHGSFIYSKTGSYDSEMVATCPLHVPMILLFLWVNPLEKQPGDLLACLLLLLLLLLSRFSRV